MYERKSKKVFFFLSLSLYPFSLSFFLSWKNEEEKELADILVFISFSSDGRVKNGMI